MPRRLFPTLVLTFAAIAAIAGLTATPPRPTPVYALQSAAVYRAEVALAVFAALYLMAVIVRLAWHGQTFTRVGSVLEVPEVRRTIDDDTAEARPAGRTAHDPTPTL